MSLPQWDREDQDHRQDCLDGLAVPHGWPTPGPDDMLAVHDPHDIEGLRRRRRWGTVAHAPVFVSSNPMCACGYTPFHWDLALAIFKINPDQFLYAWYQVQQHVNEMRSWP